MSFFLQSIINYLSLQSLFTVSILHFFNSVFLYFLTFQRKPIKSFYLRKYTFWRAIPKFKIKKKSLYCVKWLSILNKIQLKFGLNKCTIYSVLGRKILVHPQEPTPSMHFLKCAVWLHHLTHQAWAHRSSDPQGLLISIKSEQMHMVKHDRK